MYRDNTSSQTQPIQHADIGMNTNLSNNGFTQTIKPSGYNTVGINTDFPHNNFTQTMAADRNNSMQTDNTDVRVLKSATQGCQCSM